MDFLLKIALLAVLAWFGWGALHRNRALNISIRHFTQVPALTLEKVDCYVRWQGTITTPDQFTSPLGKQPCAFYKTRIVAEWQTKQKKPKRGMDRHRKILGQATPALEFLALSDKQSIHLRVNPAEWGGKGSKSILLLREQENVSTECPALCQELAQGKYKTYRSLEKTCTSGDPVIVHGKLTRRNDGQLYLTPTDLAGFPSLFLAGPQAHNYSPAYLKKLKCRATIYLYGSLILFGLTVVLGGYFFL